MDSQNFEDFYNLENIKTPKEIKESCHHQDKICTPLIVTMIFCLLGGFSLALQKKLHIPDLVPYLLFGCMAVNAIFFIIREFYNDINNEVLLASRNQIMELMENMHGLSHVEKLFCAYMEKRNYLTDDEYKRFVMTIEREKEKLEQKKFDKAIQSMCSKKD